jgi:3-hydroxybutyryl-CoA dehydrogenase
VDNAAVAKGTHVVETSRARLVAKGKMPAAEKTAALGRIQGSITYSDLKPVGVIIEAANEDYDLKAKILKQIDKSVSGDAIFASNTSSISVTMLASLISHPDRFVGVHFFNPVPVIALVEIVRGLQTSDAMHDAVTTLATRLGKSSINVKSAPGFVVNLVLLPMINEAFFVLAEDEASANEIDQGMKLGCNHPIGPLARADMIRLDVLLAVMQILPDEFADSNTGPVRCSRRWWPPGIWGANPRHLQLSAIGRCKAIDQTARALCSALRSYQRGDDGKDDESGSGAGIRRAADGRGSADPYTRAW